MIDAHDIAVFARHGGALDLARERYPLAPSPWIDLSTGINPVPYPVSGVPSAAWTRLPEASAIAALEAAAASRYAAAAGMAVVAASGSQAIIQRLPQLGGGDVRILGPTYGEYERVFPGAGTRIVSAIDDLAGADVAVVVNPNNPDGRLLRPDVLLALAPRVGLLVVDEAFMDGLPQSLAPRLPPRGTVVLRSFGKMYGLPGSRLGFAIAPAALATALRRSLGPWPVSGPAIAVAARALGDGAWIDAAMARLARDGARLAEALRAVGAEPVGATPLFRLVSHPKAGALFEVLAQNGILTRPFDGDTSWLRFGLPGDQDGFARLERGLAAFARSSR